MIPRPPTSTLFPYTTLFRSVGTIRPVEHIVEKFVLLIPQPDALTGNIVHRLGNRQEVLEELERNIFIHRIGEREFHSDSHHIQAKHAHPTRTVALLKVTTGGQGSAPVKYANIVQA